MSELYLTLGFETCDGVYGEENLQYTINNSSPTHHQFIIYLYSSSSLEGFSKIIADQGYVFGPLSFEHA